MNSGNEWPALSVRQPWAELLISGRKSIEVRTWAPDYRGRLWLHTGLKADPEPERLFGLADTYKGGFIGSIALAAVVPLTRERWIQWRENHLDIGAHRHGMLAWIVEAPRRFRTPVAGTGRLGLFRPSDDFIRKLVEADADASPQTQDP
jgi:ASCH domain